MHSITTLEHRFRILDFVDCCEYRHTVNLMLMDVINPVLMSALILIATVVRFFVAVFKAG